MTYRPVIAVFGTAALMALAASWAATGALFTVRSGEWSCCIALALIAYVYPFAEALAGILMIAGALLWIAIPVALFIGGIGAVSVFKAVYIDKRELKCACVGGDSNLPLGFISLTENLMMVAMAIWMMLK